jgi:RND family efflux transporter MFP subunit
MKTLRRSRGKACVLAAGLASLKLLLAQGAEVRTSVGITEAVFDVTLSLPVPGIIASLKVKEGDLVQTNDVLLALDSRLEEIELARRKCIMENRKTDLDSTQKVFDKSSSVSRDELLKREAEYKVSAAEYAEAEEQLQRRRLLAPGRGIVSEIKLRLGEACAAYEPVVRIVDTRQCYFISNIEAKYSARLKPGQPVQIEVEHAPAPIRVDGHLVFVSPVVDSASGLQRVKAVFDNSEGKVRPGLAGKMLLDEPTP